ncbi:MAG: VanZ family protein [Isosphaeraceae bacterium]
MKTRRSLSMLIFLGIYTLFLFDLALLQFPSKNPTYNLIPLHTIIADCTTGGRGFAVNFVGNIVAFMPIGLMPAFVRPRSARAWHVALFCLSLSLMIELGQYLSGRRTTDVDDLILNTLGGLVGYWMLRFMRGRTPAWEGSEPADRGS